MLEVIHCFSAIFKVRDLFNFALLRFVIGPKISYHPVNRSCCTLNSLLVLTFALWRLVIIFSPLIGCWCKKNSLYPLNQSGEKLLPIATRVFPPCIHCANVYFEFLSVSWLLCLILRCSIQMCCIIIALKL